MESGRWAVRLAGISIQKYRSIKRTPRLNLGDLTVLVGPNNEGKSNVLRALALSMRVLRRYGLQPAGRPATARIRISPNDYDWAEDYPKDLQAKSPDGNTIIDLWFDLDPSEQAHFQQFVGSRLRTELPVRLTIGKFVEFAVRKQGPGAATLTKKGPKVAQFVGRALRVEYVESVRTASRALEVVTDMLEMELEFNNPQVELALAGVIASLQPTIERVSSELQATLADFLPDVTKVSVELSASEVLEALSSQARIVVDDGVATDLRHKGDGVQSLAALALVRKAAGSSRKAALFLAVEEPEAHLHPRAIHRLRGVLAEIASNQQVVVTTHSPLLVNRFDLASNIIVRANRAGPAQSLGDLRDALGVRVGDNLANAGLVLLLEGGCDVTALRSLLSDRSTHLERALVGGSLAIESMGSASNLVARIDQLRSQLCLYHVLLDHDDAGISAGQKARDAGLLAPAEENYVTVPGLRHSEFEDVVDLGVYAEQIATRFGVVLDNPKFRSGKKKWSERVEAAFRDQGKNWDDKVKVLVKSEVARAVAADPGNALHSARSGSIEALVRELERRVADLP